MEAYQHFHVGNLALAAAALSLGAKFSLSYLSEIPGPPQIEGRQRKVDDLGD